MTSVTHRLHSGHTTTITTSRASNARVIDPQPGEARGNKRGGDFARDGHTHIPGYDEQDPQKLLKHRSIIAAHLDGSSPTKSLDTYSVDQLVQACDHINKVTAVAGGGRQQPSTPPRALGAAGSRPRPSGTANGGSTQRGAAEVAHLLARVKRTLEQQLAQCSAAA